MQQQRHDAVNVFKHDSLIFLYHLLSQTLVYFELRDCVRPAMSSNNIYILINPIQ